MGHSRAVETWIIGVSYFVHARIVHDFLVCEITGFLRSENDQSKHDSFVFLGTSQVSERAHVFYIEVIANTLAVFECSAILPDLGGEFCDAFVFVEAILGKGQDKSINVAIQPAKVS